MYTCLDKDQGISVDRVECSCRATPWGIIDRGREQAGSENSARPTSFSDDCVGVRIADDAATWLLCLSVDSIDRPPPITITHHAHRNIMAGSPSLSRARHRWRLLREAIVSSNPTTSTEDQAQDQHATVYTVEGVKDAVCACRSRVEMAARGCPVDPIRFDSRSTPRHTQVFLLPQPERPSSSPLYQLISHRIHDGYDGPVGLIRAMHAWLRRGFTLRHRSSTAAPRYGHIYVRTRSVDATGQVRIWPAEEALLAWCLKQCPPGYFGGNRCVVCMSERVFERLDSARRSDLSQPNLKPRPHVQGAGAGRRDGGPCGTGDRMVRT